MTDNVTFFDEAEEAEQELPIDLRVIFLDETEYWNLDPEDMALIERLGCAYAYDANTHVYACEMTPSYELWPIEPVTHFKEEVHEQGMDHFIDRIDMLQYEAMDYSVKYVHVHRIDALVEKYKALPNNGWMYVDGDLYPRQSEDYDDFDEYWEALLQAVRENGAL